MNEKTIVIFRAERSGRFKGDVTAVFPYEPGDSADNMSCYAHIGQHSFASLAWYHERTRPALPGEYESLKRELESYGPPDAHYVLEIRQRMPPDAFKRRREAMRAMDRAIAGPEKPVEALRDAP